MNPTRRKFIQYAGTALIVPFVPKIALPQSPAIVREVMAIKPVFAQIEQVKIYWRPAGGELTWNEAENGWELKPCETVEIQQLLIGHHLNLPEFARVE